MITREWLLDAIDECECEPLTTANLERLANLYTIYNHLYPQPSNKEKTQKFATSSDSDFLKAVDGKNVDVIFGIVNELVETIQLIQPALYYGLMAKIKDL